MGETVSARPHVAAAHAASRRHSSKHMKPTQTTSAHANARIRRLVHMANSGDLVDVGVLQNLQDGFADTTGISVSVRDLKGRPVTRPSCQNPFCQLVMETPAGEQELPREQPARRDPRRPRAPRGQVRLPRRPVAVRRARSRWAASASAPSSSATGPRDASPRSASRRWRTSCRYPAKKLAAALAQVTPWSDDEVKRVVDPLLSPSPTASRTSATRALSFARA